MNDINLEDLSLDNIGTWPWYLKVIVISVLFVLILVAGYFLSFKGQLKELDKEKDKEVQLIGKMKRKQTLAANLNLYRKQLVEMQKRFGKLLRQLPGEDEIPELLEEISQKGIKSGLKFQLFDPKQEIQHEFYVEVPIEIKVDGSYHQLASFVSNIAGMKRIVTLHDFKLYFPSSKSTQGRRPIRLINGKLPLFMTMTAKIYRYKVME